MEAYIEIHKDCVVLHLVKEVKEAWFYNLTEALEFARKHNIEIVKIINKK